MSDEWIYQGVVESLMEREDIAPLDRKVEQNDNNFGQRERGEMSGNGKNVDPFTYIYIILF